MVENVENDLSSTKNSTIHQIDANTNQTFLNSAQFSETFFTPKDMKKKIMLFLKNCFHFSSKQLFGFYLSCIESLGQKDSILDHCSY